MNADDRLKLIYSEILQEYSSILYNGKLICIKHLNPLDSSLIDLKKNEYVEYFKSKGAPLYQDKLDQIIAEKLWSQEKDKEIEDVKAFISNLHHTKKQYIIKKDKEIINKEIEQYNDRLLRLVLEKNKLMGKTAESRAENKIEEYYIYVSFHSDRQLQHKLFSEEEFDLLDVNELQKISHIYREKMNHFNSRNLKKIALMPYFFNLFLLTGDNIMSLFGKPIVSLTFYQVELIQNAKTYKNIITNSKTPPPPECLNDPDKLFEWFDKSETLEKVSGDNQVVEEEGRKVVTAAKSVVGMSKEELKAIGLDTSHGEKIDAELKKKGELSFTDIIKLDL